MNGNRQTHFLDIDTMANITTFDEMQDKAVSQTMGDMRREKLLSWVMGKVELFELERDRLNDPELKERYYHIWRGKYHEGMKHRASETSHLVHPATSAAIDSYMAELESATIDNDYFCAIKDDDDNHDVEVIEKQLKTDFTRPEAKIRDSMSALGLMGAIFGEACGEMHVEVIPQLKIKDVAGEAKVVRGKDRKIVKIDPFLPTQFIYDPGASSVEDSLGLGYKRYIPFHVVTEKQSQGIWRKEVDVQVTGVTNKNLLDSELGPSTNSEVVEITKWNGKVPKALLDKSDDKMSTMVDTASPELQRVLEVDENDLVEGMVVIMNGAEILMDKKNPTLLKDRLFLYHRMERVPTTLHGRGVAEKAHSPQSALDGNMRAQMDATAKVVHPVFGVNRNLAGTRGFKFKQKPGQVNIFNGDPRAAVARLDLGDVSPTLFQNTEKLEQLVATATNTFDTSALNQTGSIASQGGATMAVTSFVKRAKMSIRNFNEDVIIPFVNVAARLYMQLEPEIYKPTDVTFTAIGTMGALAREIEQAHALNLMKTVPQDTPGWWVLFRSVMVNSNFADKESMIEFADAMLEQSIQPPQPDPLVDAQIAEIQNRIANQSQDTRTNSVRALAETARVSLDMANSDVESAKTFSEIILNVAKAEAEEAGSQMPLYKGLAQQLVGDENQRIENSGTFPREEIQIARATSIGGANQILGE